MKGRFIVLEGIDGCGKTTQINHLKAWLPKSGLMPPDAILHITYLPLKNNLPDHIEESRSLAYKHNMRADAISESVYMNTERQVFGLLYDYDGLTATATQFYLTDSVNHFFRGALYFNTEVVDSLMPINNFIKEDVKNIIESFRWVVQ